MSRNNITLIGHIGKDPETRQNYNGSTVSRFSLAETISRKDANGDWISETQWHRIEVWNNKRDLRKGDLISVNGYLRYGSYETNEGTKVNTVDIVAKSISMLKRKEPTTTAEPQNDPYGNLIPSDPNPQDIPF